MRFFQKTSVAVLITVLVVALCCVWGYSRVYDFSAVMSTQEPTHRDEQQAGTSNLNYYLRLVEDKANIFDLTTTDAIARCNLVLDSSYDSVLAIQTVTYLNGSDIQTAAERAASQAGLGQRDLFLYLDTDSQGWYVIYGSQMASYVEADDSLPTLFRQHLNQDFWVEGAGSEVILSLFDDVEAWYSTTVPQTESSNLPYQQEAGKLQSITLSGIVNSILLTLLANLWWIAILFLALFLGDQFRFERFYRRSKGCTDPTMSFRPLLFWHRTDSHWFIRMKCRMDEAEEDDEDEDDPSEQDPFAPGGAYRTGADSAGANQAGTGQEAPHTEREQTASGFSGASEKQQDSYTRGPGYSTDPNEPGPFTPPPGPGPQSPPQNNPRLTDQLLNLAHNTLGLAQQGLDALTRLIRKH